MAVVMCRDKGVQRGKVHLTAPAGGQGGVNRSRSQVSHSRPQREGESMEGKWLETRAAEGLSDGLVLPDCLLACSGGNMEGSPQLLDAGIPKFVRKREPPACSFLPLRYLSCQRLFFPTKHLCLVISL